MRILVTGRGNAASWTIRGEQLGAAMGATVKPNATLADMRAADVIVVVKRIPLPLLLDLRRSRKPWAYDIVDAYPQREAMSWTRGGSIEWLRRYVRGLAPDLMIWPNAKMREDAEIDGTVVYHHARPGMPENPIRDRIKTLGYEGSDRYLDGIRDILQAVCARRGIDFVCNPARLADVDVVLAMRSPAWKSYAAANWKSNVKLANAHGSCTPFIGAPESGYVEMASGREYWANNPGEVGQALDWLAERSTRLDIARVFRQSMITVESSALLMRAALCKLKS